MIKLRKLLLVPILLLAVGCTIPSKNMVGLQDYKLDPYQIDGTWINSDGAVALKVMDPDKGVVRMVILDTKEKPEILDLKIMKGNSWLYFNLLPEKDGPDKMYNWGRVVIEEKRLIAWHPSDKAFLKAIAAGNIQGTIKPEAITDTAKNIVDLVESSENAYFQWDEPMFLIKLAK